MPKKRAYFSLQLYARQKTKQAFDTIVNVMEQPKTPPQARLMAAGMVIDRGWGKAAQLVAIDGEIRQLVEVKLSVVQPKTLDAVVSKDVSRIEDASETQAISTDLGGGSLRLSSDAPGDAK